VLARTPESSAAATGSPVAPRAAGLAVTVQSLTELAAASLERARQQLDAIRSATGPRTLANTLVPYDEVAVQLDASASLTGLLERVHPDPEVRTAAEKWTQEISQFATALSLDRAVYDALRGLDVSAEDAPTRYYVERTLRDFRRSGVDREEAVRERIRVLSDELVHVGQEFARNIQSDRRNIEVGRADLDGLPADYVASHPPDTAGRITITTDYPDYVPFMSYSTSGNARQALYRAFRSRGYPANIAVLDRMLALRHEYATLLGYRSWAHYVTEDKMIRTDTAAREFIERVAAIAETRARQDYAELLRRKRQDEPATQEVHDWERDFYEERIKLERYRVDSQAMRAFFPYEKVKQGLLDVTARLFGIEYRRVEAATVWAPGVETYDVYENGARFGRLHLDMHPRDDKYKHAAQFNLVNGIGGRQLPEAALVCNFPGGEPGDPGLLEHDDVTTFFHEFGHLLHNLFAGKQRWMGIAGISTEWDFVEAPSQMLEEWAWDATVLQTFAHHYETGAPIPVDMVERARRGREFGRGTYARQQMFYAMLSLRLHDRDPQGVDTTQIVRDLQDEYSMFRYVDGTHFHASFGHLEGYSAIYYTYMWSLVIARDLFSQFASGDLLEPKVARHYRETVLEAGGSAPAAELVERFLGRPFGFEAFERWLGDR
jgi:thimet oligopeptidase